MKHTLNLLASMLCFLINTKAQPGFLDKSFGDEGIVITDVNPGGQFNYSYCAAAGLQKDGKIIAAGTGSYIDKSGFLLIRYNTAGKVDSSFGKDGRAIIEFSIHGGEDLLSIAVLDDDKIIAAGWGGYDEYNDLLLAKYNQDGSIDSTFGENGIVVTDLGGSEVLSDMAVQPDGKIVVTTLTGGKTVFIVRYMPDGSRDKSFGNNGVVTTLFSDFVKVNTVAVQKNGDILIGGTFAYLSASTYFFIARFLPDGRRDAEFGNGGEVIVSFTEYNFSGDVYDIAIQNDGSIVAGGVAGTGFALVRVSSYGVIDASFGKEGKLLTSIFNKYGEARSVLIQNDGKIIATGNAYDKNGTNSVFALARYESNGTLDKTFGIEGVQTTMINNSAYSYASVLQEDNQIVIAGLTYPPGTPASYFALARYYGGDAVLPITYNHFSAAQSNNAVTLDWQTAGENNNVAFGVERSATGNSFTEIAKVNSKGSALAQQYFYTDKFPATGNNYYRIKQLNTSGQYSYSKTVSVQFMSVSTVRLYPNPAKDFITIDGLNTTVVNTITVFDLHGKSVLNKNTQSASCKLSISQLASGAYFVKVISDKTTTTLKFEK